MFNIVNRGIYNIDDRKTFVLQNGNVIIRK